MSKLHVFKNAEISTTAQMNSQGGETRAERRKFRAAEKVQRLLTKANRRNARIERGFLTDAQTKRNQMIVDRNLAAAIRISGRHGFLD